MNRSTLVAAFGDHLDRLPKDDRSQLWLSGHVVEFFRAHLLEAVTALGGIDAVVEAAEEAYRKYAAPIDIPGLPNVVIEPAVDRAAEQLIGAGLRLLYVRMTAGS